MFKRYYVALILFFCFTGSAVAQDEGKAAFMRLTDLERETLQSYLSEAGLYRSDVDGLWGQGTSNALTTVAAQLSESGLFYDIQTVDSAEALYRFLLSRAGQETLLSEGSECDGCNTAMNDSPVSNDKPASHDETAYGTAKIPGVFEAVPPSSYTGAELIPNQSPMGGRDYCIAKLGSFTDGNDVIQIVSYRRYDMWGFVIVSDKEIAPPMFLPDLYDTEPLMMAVTSSQSGDQWVSEFSNTNKNYMDQLDQNTSITLSVGGGSYVFVKIPFLPQVISELRSCTQADDARHMQKYCLETIPRELMAVTRECSAFWN